MIKAIAIALLACLVALASQYGAEYWRLSRAARSPVETAAALETRKTKEINIPRIKDGAVKGYVVVMLNYAVDLKALNAHPLPPDAVVTDEAFRYIYNDDSIDFDHLDRFDIGKMSSTLVKNVNDRLKGEVVRDLGVQEFTFVPSGEAKSRQ